MSCQETSSSAQNWVTPNTCSSIIH